MLATHRAGGATSCSDLFHVQGHAHLRAFKCHRRAHRRLQRELRAQYEDDRYITGTPELHIVCYRLFGRLLGSTIRLSSHSSFGTTCISSCAASGTGWTRIAVACLHNSLAAAPSQLQHEQLLGNSSQLQCERLERGRAFQNSLSATLLVEGAPPAAPPQRLCRAAGDAPGRPAGTSHTAASCPVSSAGEDWTPSDSEVVPVAPLGERSREATGGFAGVRALVAGATGGTGRAIVERLVAEGVPVRALVRNVAAAVRAPRGSGAAELVQVARGGSGARA